MLLRPNTYGMDSDWSLFTACHHEQRSFGTLDAASMEDASPVCVRCDCASFAHWLLVAFNLILAVLHLLLLSALEAIRIWRVHRFRPRRS